MKIIYIIIGLTLSFATAQAQWTSPDEHSPSCASTPAELANQVETLARINTVESSDGKIGLDALVGVWKYSSAMGKATVSVYYDESGFFVQNEDDVPEKASLCIDDEKAGWVRVSLHDPGCPENKNIYVKAVKTDVIGVNLFMTRYMGGVKMNKASSTPLPPGLPKPPVKCADPEALIWIYEGL